MFAGMFLDWAALLNYFKGLTSAPYIHQYLMSIRFENQNRKSEELQQIFCISYYQYIFHSHLWYESLYT